MPSRNTLHYFTPQSKKGQDKLKNLVARIEEMAKEGKGVADMAQVLGVTEVYAKRLIQDHTVGLRRLRNGS